tara:strand:+ start:1103 stop:1330 length:228 start_codon:yes stop_codon:yes gene_type:complete
MKVSVKWDYDNTDYEELSCEAFLEATGIPALVEIPEHIVKEYQELKPDDPGDADYLISDWLSNEYGWCHYGWKEE